jgi:hypothetical protein
MADNSPTPPSDELFPHLLYRAENDQARFATWAVKEGHETLALFSTAETAAQYRGELPEPDAWHVYQPTKPKLIEILQLSQRAGLLYAALDPSGGSAKTLFDIPQVLQASQGSGAR